MNWPEATPFSVKLAVAGFFITGSLSVIFEWSVGEIDLGSSVGGALQFVFWCGIGALYESFKAGKDDRKFYLYAGLVASLLPVVLIIFIAIGGILSYVALAISIIICFFLGYLQRRS